MSDLTAWGRYVKRPVTVHAIQFDGTREIEGHLRAAGCIFHWGWDPILGNCLKIQTLEGEFAAIRGGYIICGIQGEFYPCKPDIFRDSYEEAPDELPDVTSYTSTGEAESVRIRKESDAAT